MRIDFLTLFPEMCKTVMDESIIGRAQKKGAVEVCYHQIRDYANNKHNRVDAEWECFYVRNHLHCVWMT